MDKSAYSNESYKNTKMVGTPCYQIYKSIDYQMGFNNQNFSDEVMTKMLLMLPMVPKKYLSKIKLNHLKLYQDPNAKVHDPNQVKTPMSHQEMQSFDLK